MLELFYFFLDSFPSPLQGTQHSHLFFLCCSPYFQLQYLSEQIYRSILLQFQSLTFMRKLATFKRNNEDKSNQLGSGMSEENFKIYLRVKPIQDLHPDNNIIKIPTPNKVEIISPYYSANDIEKHYNYEQVFAQEADNEQVFHKTMIQPIQNALQGYNSTVFIYGMTGAGKTYTMFGNFGCNSTRNYEEQGLVSKTIDYMFDRVQKQTNVKTQIQVSFYEIYNENIKDLLQEDLGQVNIMEDPVRGVFINGIEEVNAEERSQTKEVIIQGIQRRAMNATKSNEVSSRSHAILQFTIRRYYYNAGDEAQVLESKFFMIDLAGNEKTSNNQSKRFIEGVNINKSLLTLGKCLSILAENKNSYVPFRDSKLTRILKQSLGGNSKTVMIACVSSEKRFYQETLNTLKYSSVAKRIKNKGIKHNIRAICKEDMPDTRACVVKDYKTQFQFKVKTILTEFLSSIQQKSKIQRIVEELEHNRHLNEQLTQTEGDNRQAFQNMVKIDSTIKQMNRVYERNLQKSEKTYQTLMDTINLAAKQKDKNQRKNDVNEKEMNRLREMIRIQQERIKELENQNNQSTFGEFSKKMGNGMESPQLTDKEHSKSILTQIYGKENVLSPYNQNGNSQRSNGKGRKLTINCHFDEASRSNLKALNQSNVSDVSRRSHKIKPHREIVINLNTDKNHLKSCSFGNKQTFLSRLKETDKKAKGEASQSQIRSLIQQHEQCQYQLGNVEMSMIRKLKFYQREKSMQKSNSLNRFPLRSTSSSKNSLTIRNN